MKTELASVGPQVIIPGFGKSGTTSFCSLLEQHPSVSFGIKKEPYTFLRGDVRGLPYQILFAQKDLLEWDWHEDCTERLIEAYTEHYPDAADREDILRCDGSQPYCKSDDAAARVAQYLPKTKLIFLLRHPVKRALSEYRFRQNRNWTTLPFLRSVAFEWHSPVSTSCYVDRLKPWLDRFPREQFLFLSFEEFVSDHASVMDRVCTFLDIPSMTFGELGHDKLSRSHYSETMHRLLNYAVLVGRPKNAVPVGLRSTMSDDKVSPFSRFAARAATRLLRELPQRTGYPDANPEVLSFLHALLEKENRGLSEMTGVDFGSTWRMDV